jgi:hypothetical protein
MTKIESLSLVLSLGIRISLYESFSQSSCNLEYSFVRIRLL